MEQWHDVRGFEGYYKVSSLGRVYSFITNKLLKVSPTSRGYVSVNLWKDNKPVNRKVHRLVCDAFIQNNELKRCINHKDGNKENNNVENLEWCTHSENTTHAFKNGLMMGYFGSDHPRSKCVINLETGVFYETCTDAAVAHQISQPYLSEMLTNKKPNKTKLIYV